VLPCRLLAKPSPLDPTACCDMYYCSPCGPINQHRPPQWFPIQGFLGHGRPTYENHAATPTASSLVSFPPLEIDYHRPARWHWASSRWGRAW